VAGSWPTACAHELALFKQLAGPGVEVERVAHIQAGDPVCAYVLRAAEANGRPRPPGPPSAPGR
jgi:predicted ArsR family transcriptional regulator